MDPLSTTASIIAILQLSSEVVKYINTAAGATKDRQRLRNEVRACEHIIEQLKDQADDSDEGQAWSETIKALEAPDAPLGRLAVTLRIVAAKLRPKEGFEKALERLKWPFREKEVDKILAAIEREKSLLSLALDNSGRKLIQEIQRSSNENRKLLAEMIETLKQGADKSAGQFAELLYGVSRIELSQGGLRDSLEQLNNQQCCREAAKDRQEILSWITPIDYNPQQNDFIDRRQPGTGQWLLDSAEFKTWVETEKQTLFCPGIPGAGKTIATSIVVDDLKRRFAEKQNIGIAYIYCNFRRKHEQRAEDLLASLLKQLAEGFSSLPEIVKALYDTCQQKKTKPSFDEISKTLQVVAASYSRVFIIIDALDECQESDGVRARFLPEILSLRAKYTSNLFATSRFVPDIVERFEGSISLEIRGSDEDVRRYIEGHISVHMPQLQRLIKRSPQLQEDIRIGISDSVDGMFLLAQIYLASLSDKTTPKAVRSAVAQFQKQAYGSGEEKKLQVLSKAYDITMDRILGQELGFRELAIKALQWITRAMRPLSTSELQHALAVEIGEPKLDKDNLPEIEGIVSVCAGLVTVDEESGVIRLVHYTTQEYFERTQAQWFPTAEADITTVCVAYLSFDIFATGRCQTEEEFEERLQTNKLYDYAACYWGYHAHQVPAICQGVLHLLGCESKVEAASQALMVGMEWQGVSRYSQIVPLRMNGLHLAGYFGIERITQLLVDKKDPDMKDSYGRTPLSYASENGHEAVVKLLLEKGADIEIKDSDSQTPLVYAAWYGHEAVAKLLLEKGADIETKDSDSQTPLMYAAENGHEAVAKLLLEKGADIETKDSDGWTPLVGAARCGHEAVAKPLLEKGADIETKDSDGWTPLIHAARCGHEAVAKLLLEKGADIETKDSDGWTPLLHAAWNGHEAVVKLLLEKGADVEIKDSDSQTPLTYAAQNEHEAVVKLLLENGAESR